MSPGLFSLVVTVGVALGLGACVFFAIGLDRSDNREPHAGKFGLIGVVFLVAFTAWTSYWIAYNNQLQEESETVEVLQ